MTVKTAFKYIFLAILIALVLLIGYVVQAGFAVVHVKTPDARVWVPVPLAFGHLAGYLLDIPLKTDGKFQEVWQYRDAAAEILRQLPGLPDADLVQVDSGQEHVRIFKRGDALFVQVDTPREKVNVRLPMQTVEQLADALEKPNANLGDLVACLDSKSSGDVVYVKTDSEEVRISVW
jgi:hypothetical protein